MIDESVLVELEEMVRRSRPVFGDLTVGDITEENMPLLEKALDGDEKSLYRLLYLEERSRKASEQVIIRGPFTK